MSNLISMAQRDQRDQIDLEDLIMENPTIYGPNLFKSAIEAGQFDIAEYFIEKFSSNESVLKSFFSIAIDKKKSKLIEEIAKKINGIKGDYWTLLDKKIGEIVRSKDKFASDRLKLLFDVLQEAHIDNNIITMCIMCAYATGLVLYDDSPEQAKKILFVCEDYGAKFSLLSEKDQSSLKDIYHRFVKEPKKNFLAKQKRTKHQSYQEIKI